MGSQIKGPNTGPAEERWNNLLGNSDSAVDWDWFALLRLIQAACPDIPRIGYGILLREDPVRLAQPPFFHPPVRTIAELRVEENNATSRVLSDFAAPWLYSYHMGLFGPFGPMPLHWTEIAHRQSRSAKPYLSAFCDVFHHRFLCFFFRAWADARKETCIDRVNFRADEGDRNSGGGRTILQECARDSVTWDLYVGALGGLGLRALLKRDRIPDHAKLFFAGRLAQSARNSEGLQAILEEYFGVAVEVLCFVPRENQIPMSARLTLSSSSHGTSGFDSFLGESYRDFQRGFRILLGPMRMADYRSFLPGRAGLTEIRDWIRLYLGLESDANLTEGLDSTWDVQLILDKSEVPDYRIGSGEMLGWTTWLKGGNQEGSADDLVVSPLSADFDSIPPGREGETVALKAERGR